jgi:hypothetical protein
MEGISSAGSMSAMQFEVQLQTRVLAMQKDMVDQQGDLALELIQAATIDSAVGRNVNTQV